jgi:hypothetical protein
MRAKLLNALLILTSLFGYLSWGMDQSAFLFQAEYDWFATLITDPMAAAHPFTLIPLLGQVLLLVSLFQQKPSKGLTLAGIASIGLLLGFMFVIGLLTGIPQLWISTVPFLGLSGIVIWTMFRKNSSLTPASH